MHPAAPGESPFGDDDRLAGGVVERVLDEPSTDVVDERAVLERVDPPGRDLADRRRPVRTEGGHGDDRGDDKIDGDHVDGSLGNAWKLAQQAAAVGEDHRLRHAEATDPPWARLGPCRLDDRRPNDAHRHVAAGIHEGLFAERLGVGVGIRPADTRCSRSAGLDELIANPPLAQLLRLGGQGGGAGRAELAAGVGAEPDEAIGAPAGGLAVAPQPARRGDLVAPAQTEVERALRHELLGSVAAAIAGDITRRHGDEMWCHAELAEQRGDAGGTEQVDLHGRVER